MVALTVRRNKKITATNTRRAGHASEGELHVMHRGPDGLAAVVDTSS